ncbi:glycosyltransferase family 39 protein [Jatrophihabitans endophyticus]|uniref:glycosyltransferase family 39 protein n=1 Tax=Jatrophihabitans endophyticus TaxID=1206085 RepID=UPI0019F305D0|nr:glycosyltransferase family 39 protein [Jatrophihabitans endophyticus]MBE7187110.1 glycosyltransferase family 39 protein [Jatrophihabitans endophyticus]
MSSDMPRAARAGRDPVALGLAVAITVALIATATRYGYHGDELYFVEAGQHPAWGYADQGPLTPLLARLLTGIDAGSLTVLRLPSALATGAVTVLTASMAGRLGAGRTGQRIAASCVAFSVFVVFTGHLLSTSTIDLLVWTLASYFAVLALQTGNDRYWIAVGATLGVGLFNKPLPAFLAAALLIGIAIGGPRRVLGRPGFWVGAALVVVSAVPFVAWQSMHGWPQLTVAASIAGGGSTSSQPWWAVVPFQVLLVGPPLAPIWIAGLVRTFRGKDPVLRCFGWAWVVLAVAFMATGGKPYYLAGLLPLLVAAGAAPTERWLSRGAGRRRPTLVGAGVAVSAVAVALLALPLLPASDAGLAVAVNPDVGETIGWPDLVATTARVVDAQPDPHAVVLLADYYDEAGALDRYGPRYGLPQAYSGHNAFGYWGPPHAAADRPVVVVGYSVRGASAYLRGCRLAARVHDAAGVQNNESGDPVVVCRGVHGSWAAQWPRIRHLG